MELSIELHVLSLTLLGKVSEVLGPKKSLKISEQLLQTTYFFYVENEEFITCSDSNIIFLAYWMEFLINVSITLNWIVLTTQTLQEYKHHTWI